MPRLLVRLIFASLLTSALMACGNKGPLVLPDPEAPPAEDAPRE